MSAAGGFDLRRSAREKARRGFPAGFVVVGWVRRAYAVTNRLSLFAT